MMFAEHNTTDLQSGWTEQNGYKLFRASLAVSGGRIHVRATIHEAPPRWEAVADGETKLFHSLEDAMGWAGNRALAQVYAERGE